MLEFGPTCPLRSDRGMMNHMLIEKPIADTLSAAARIIAAAGRHVGGPWPGGRGLAEHLVALRKGGARNGGLAGVPADGALAVQ
jgi:hypothetical protein